MKKLTPLLPTPLPMSYIESAYMRWYYTNDITREWVSSLSIFVSNLRKYYQHDQCVVLYADVQDFWQNSKLEIKLV
jgi:hypothetical protein